MKTLVAYFSWSGHTTSLAGDIANKLGYDLVRIEREIPYSKDYNICAYTEAKAEVESGALPNIKPIDIDFYSYDRILLFFPVWWYTYPAPVGTFLKNLGEYGGEIYYFANSYTFDPQYMVNIDRDMKALSPRLLIKAGLFNKTLQQHLDFLKSL